MKEFFKQEPVVIVGLVQNLLALLAAFGFDLITPAQSAAIVAFVSAATILIRSIVFSPASAEAIAKTATDPPPSRDEAAKAAMALGVPVELAEKAATLALGGLLPANWISLIVTTAAGVDYSKLEAAVRDALARRPTTEELIERSKEGV